MKLFVWCDNVMNIQDVSKMLAEISGFPHTKTGKKVHIILCSQTLSFRGTAPTFAGPQSFRILPVRTLKILLYSAWSENEETPHKRIFMPVGPFLIAPGPLEGWDSPWSDVSMRAFNQVDDIFGIWCKLWLVKNKNWAVITLVTCILNVFWQFKVKHYLVKVFVVGYENINTLISGRVFI
jgi:hypothetical protein